MIISALDSKIQIRLEACSNSIGWHMFLVEFCVLITSVLIPFKLSDLIYVRAHKDPLFNRAESVKRLS